jgi:hypothetical protein
VNIRKAPEYFLNIYIVRQICEAFQPIGYRLEMPVNELLNILELDNEFIDESIRAKGKFDILLTSRKSGRPRHIIEVKRTLKLDQICKEARRLMALASSPHENKRLKSGFIAAVAKISSTERSQNAIQIIDDRINKINEETKNEFKTSCFYRLMPPDTLGFENGDALLLTVFEISKRS